MGFDPCNCFLKIQDSNSQGGRSLGSVRVHSFTLSYTSGSMRCDSRAFLLARTLASPCLGCEPKARVATLKEFKEFYDHMSNMTMLKIQLLMINWIEVKNMNGKEPTILTFCVKRTRKKSNRFSHLK
jgi:hypothetical protein